MEVNIYVLGEHVLLGSFNIHVNKKDDVDTVIFLDTLQSLGLQNRVEFPAHSH